MRDKADGAARRYAPIRDYAAIGDCHGAALISREGAVDWCCLGQLDGDPVFCRLLDAERGGVLAVRPDGAFSVARGYAGDTNILHTTFTTADGGVARVTDFMPVGRQPDAGAHDYVSLNAPGCLVRIIEGTQGEVALKAEYRPSIAFARRHATLAAAGGRVTAAGGPTLHHDLDGFDISGDSASAGWTLRQGERRVLVLAPADVSPADGAAGDIAAWAEAHLETTRAFWEEWIDYCRYDGPYAAAVRRSALALKLLIFAPTGAIAAALTTSLPEEIGGSRNWDYRFCWLRDASFTLYALAALGYGGEARHFSEYLPKACGASAPDLQIMYGLNGETELTEETLGHLEGYCGSRPVRIGNEAYEQHQIDVYGELLDWALLFDCLGGRFDEGTEGMLRGAADFVAEHWREPDRGLWEMRGPPRHHVHGKIMCWVALDRAIRLLGETPKWRQERDNILRDIDENGRDPAAEHFVQAYGEPGTDAALLLTPMLGFPTDQKTLAATVDAIEAELRQGDYVYRYKGEDGLEGGEGAFLICSFWLVDALLCLDRGAEARALFERLCACANDVGLFAEEIDPESGAFLGNMPQAFTHLALIASATHLALYEKHGAEGVRGSPAARAKSVVGATLGWSAMWAAFRTTWRVGRVLPSQESILGDDDGEAPPSGNNTPGETP